MPNLSPIFTKTGLSVLLGTMPARRKSLPLGVFLLLAIFGLALPARADDCTAVPASSSSDVTAFSTCKRVTNNNSAQLCATTYTSGEWSSFYNNPPGSVTIGTCVGGIPYCWGYNGAYYHTGNGSAASPVYMPSAVTLPSGVTTFSSIMAAYYNVCGIGNNGTLYCWGMNDYYQLGDGTSTTRTTPVAVTLPSGVTAFSPVAPGVLYTCAIASAGTNAGKAYCWGYNLRGQVGDSTTVDKTTPTLVTMPSGRTFTKISSGYYTTCAIADNGNAYCWGYNNTGQVGDNTTVDRSAPTAVTMPSGRTFTQISSHLYNSCAIADNGNGYCWGQGANGLNGDSTTTDRLIPTAVTMPGGGVTFTSIAVGQKVACALGSNNRVYCWGTAGYVGDGAGVQRNAPTLVSLPSGVTSFSAVDTSNSVSCAIGNNSKAYCWGSDSLYGLSGTGTWSKAYDPPSTAVNESTGAATFVGISARGQWANCVLATTPGSGGSCGGYSYSGSGSTYCYYLAADNQSCTDACSAHGGHNLTGTQSTGGNDTYCGAMAAYFANGVFDTTVSCTGSPAAGSGCFFYYSKATSSTARCSDSATAAAATSGYTRVCACNS